jgi:putative ABC transport system ATP-binding protein
MTIVARLEGCHRHYATGGQIVRAMDGIDLEVEEGALIALCGPSGSGKTTTLNVLGGLDEVDEGRVFVEEVELGSIGGSARARLRLEKIGFVFQAYNLVPVLTAAENVAFVLELRGVAADEANRRACAMLERVGLAEQTDRRPGALSGGQQQRVAVARAIVGEPRLLLADEPTANLDTTTALALLDLLAELNVEAGVTMVFSTHDPRVMERARTLVRLTDGRITSIERREAA